MSWYSAPTRASRPFAPIALLALSARFAMAIVCAYVPGASRLNRRSSGRLRSDHSSSVEVGVHARELLGAREQHDRDRRPTRGVQPPHSALQPMSIIGRSSVSPIARAAMKYAAAIAKIATCVWLRSADDPHRERGGRPADQVEEQRVRPAELALSANQHGEHHRRDHPDARVEQHAHDDRGECDRDELGMHALRQVRDQRRRDDHDQEDDREQQHGADRRVELRPEQQQRQPEDRRARAC